VQHVQTSADLRKEWFRSSDVVGITAGTSTPDTVISEAEHRLRDFAAHMAVQTNQSKETHELAIHVS
jgi:4-hydroxy-3-methylbut-2-enyl diphosphate reductase